MENTHIPLKDIINDSVFFYGIYRNKNSVSLSEVGNHIIMESSLTEKEDQVIEVCGTKIS